MTDDLVDNDDDLYSMCVFMHYVKWRECLGASQEHRPLRVERVPARPDNVLRGPFGGVAAGNADGKHASRRTEGMSSRPNVSGDGTTHVHDPLQPQASICHRIPTRRVKNPDSIPQNPDSTGQRMYRLRVRLRR